jgi:hypothetical protein
MSKLVPWLRPWPEVRALYAAQLLKMLRLEAAAKKAGWNLRPKP